MVNKKIVELELTSDADMYLFFQRYMSGRVSYTSNNKYLKFYDQKQKSNYIMYLDPNNLVGHAISKFLPTDGFKWIEPKESESSKFYQ